MPARLTDINGHLLAFVKDAGLEPHARYDLIIERIPAVHDETLRPILASPLVEPVPVEPEVRRRVCVIPEGEAVCVALLKVQPCAWLS